MWTLLEGLIWIGLMFGYLAPMVALDREVRKKDRVLLVLMAIVAIERLIVFG